MPSPLQYAQELHRVHGILPVAITETPEAGAKLPLGGTGWNLMPLADRWHLFEQSNVCGVGAQFGPVIHPVHGWCDARGIDVDEKDPTKRHAFAVHLLQGLSASGVDVGSIVWRWGKGPAAVLFTRGEWPREKYGSIQLLGPGKQAVLWGRYRNKAPQEGDPTEYTWPDGDIFARCPPIVDIATLDRCIIAACQAADIPIAVSTAKAADAEPLTAAQFAALSPEVLAEYKADFQARFNRIQEMPQGSGRGTALYGLGCDYGALMHFSDEWKKLLDTAVAILPGSGGAGDQRDLTSGINDSKGLKQQAQSNRAIAAAQSYEQWQATQPVIYLDSTTGQQRTQWVVDTLNLSASGHRVRKRAMTERQLRALYVPPHYPRLEGLLPGSGTIIFAGDAKAGKTYFLHAACRAIANGGMYVGRQTLQCKVLYITFEEDDRQVKERTERIGDENQPAADNMLHDQYDAGMGTLGHDCKGGLLEHIDSRLAEHPGTKVVVLDTLYEAFGDIEGGANSNTNGAKIEKRSAQVLTAYAKSRDILLIMPHHTNKSTGGRTHRVGGSIQLQGGVDGVLSMELVEDNPYHMTVKGTIRGLGHIDEEYTREENTTMWSPLRAPVVGGNKAGTQADTVFNLLVAANCELTNADISLRLPALTNPGVVLSRLREQGKIQNKHRGFYGIPGAKQRNEGVIIGLIQRGIVKTVTDEVRKLHDPEGKHSHYAGTDAVGWAYTEDVIAGVEAAGFAEGKETVKTMCTHKVMLNFKGVTWFFGEAWGNRAPTASQAATVAAATWNAPQAAFVLPWEAGPGGAAPRMALRGTPYNGDAPSAQPVFVFPNP